MAEEINLAKLAVAVLEDKVRKIIGDDAIKELRKPLIESELQKSIVVATERAEEKWLDKFSVTDRDIYETVKQMPLSDLPVVRNAIREFYDNPSTPVTAQVFRDQLKNVLTDDFNATRIESAIASYMEFLRAELVNIEGLRDKLDVLAAIETARNTGKITDELKEIKHLLASLTPSIESSANNINRVRSDERSSETNSQLRIKRKGEETWLVETTYRIVTIGRSPDRDVCIQDPKVSWYHGYIEKTTDQYRYHNTSPTNTTKIRRYGQEYLLTQKRMSEIALQNSDRIEIGDTILIVELDLTSGSSGYITTEKQDG